MKYNLLIVVVTCILFLTACSSVENINVSDKAATINWNELASGIIPSESDSPSTEIDLESGNYIFASVEHITDGDTISINKLNLDYIEQPNIRKDIKNEISEEGGSLSIRFLSIDTPEITKGKNELYGKKAKEMVESLLKGGQVILEVDPLALFDKYNRMLVHVYTSDKQNVQQALLENGLARTAYLYKDYKYIDTYKKAESAAKQKRLNIHSINGYVKEKEIAGFNMDVMNTYDFNSIVSGDPPDIVKRMKDINVFDLFNFIF